MADDEDEREAKPSQIPLLDEVVDEGLPKKRRRRPRREKNFDLDLEGDPPETGDLFGELLDDLSAGLNDDIGATGAIASTPSPTAEPPHKSSSDTALRAHADEVVERLVKEYAHDIIHRLRDELTQLLTELDEPDGTTAPASLPAQSAIREKIWDGPPLSAWDPWLPVEVARRLEGTTARWAVVGGWAVDLFLRRQTRPHEDIEICVPRTDFPLLLAFFQDCELFTVFDGDVRRLRPTEPIPPHIHQIWIVERATGKWRLDVMLEPGDEETWIYRRDESLRVPRSEITLGRNGIPFLSPEVVLLFKAKHCREKDEADFHECLQGLTSDRRAWLSNALSRFHEEHHWLQAL